MDGLLEPAALPLSQAVSYLGMSISSLYEAIQRGDLDARKCGRKTLVLKQSCDRFLADLPAAQISRAARPAKSKVEA